VRFPVYIAIPNNYVDLVRAINAGEPISPQNRSVFAQQIGKWCSRLQSGSVRPEKLTGAKKLFSFFGAGA
jgi:pilus assembly protein CpaE